MIELPITREASSQILSALYEGRILSFAEEYSFGPDHFLIADAEQDNGTPLHNLALNGWVDPLVQALEAQGKYFSMHHFLVKDAMGSTPLHAAAVRGYIDHIAAAVALDGERLEAKHLLQKSNDGLTPLKIACTLGHGEQVFDPALWVGRVGEMEALWREVPKSTRAEIDYARLRQDAILWSVQGIPKRNAADFSLARRGAAANVESPAGQDKGRV